FDRGPHSIVEPAVYGIPVAYGPRFGSHYHCVGLQECGGGQAVRDAAGLCAWYDRLTGEPATLQAAGNAARQYCEKGAGAAQAILREIFPPENG
ncbi:MAG: 3-deoxy-D-manno-octulosonic acid transferase, partial [Bacteroidales bacterium]|nr:3-deoxy-D-manno-octulosonic acid transferase [Bacteroidales bacterium]